MTQLSHPYGASQGESKGWTRGSEGLLQGLLSDSQLWSLFLISCVTGRNKNRYWQVRRKKLSHSSGMFLKCQVITDVKEKPRKQNNTRPLTNRRIRLLPTHSDRSAHTCRAEQRGQRAYTGSLLLPVVISVCRWGTYRKMHTHTPIKNTSLDLFCWCLRPRYLRGAIPEWTEAGPIPYPGGEQWLLAKLAGVEALILLLPAAKGNKKQGRDSRNPQSAFFSGCREAGHQFSLSSHAHVG